MTRMMNPHARILPAAVASLLSWSATACSPHTDSANAPNAVPVTVRTERIAVADVRDTFETGGVVQARTSAILTARIVAPVREVRVAPGDRVRAGQVLVVLDGRDLHAHARGATAAAAASAQGATAAAAEERAAEASLTLARATYQRVATLHAKRSATQHELDAATAALRAAEAQVSSAAARAQEAVSGVETARAASEAAGTTESFTRITSPYDGIVTEKLVEPGNMAAPGTPLVRVEDTRGFRLDVRVDESRAGLIAPDAIVEILLDTSAAGGSTKLEGKIAEIARAVEADARAFVVKIALPDTPGVRSGMFGRARFSGAPRKMLTVPERALVRRGQVTSVFVVDKNIARLRLVSVRDREVLAGLSEGEVVIVDPPPVLVDGAAVKGEGR